MKTRWAGHKLGRFEARRVREYIEREDRMSRGYFSDSLPQEYFTAPKSAMRTRPGGSAPCDSIKKAPGDQCLTIKRAVLIFAQLVHVQTKPSPYAVKLHLCMSGSESCLCSPGKPIRKRAGIPSHPLPIHSFISSAGTLTSRRLELPGQVCTVDDQPVWRVWRVGPPARYMDARIWGL